jgi:hypothetical protein
VTRREVATIGIGVAFALLVGFVVALWAHALNSSDYVGGSSSLLGIIGTVPLIAALAVATWTRWHRSCAVPYCLRTGEHPVDGTLKKVCNHHHTREHHSLVYDLHHADHVASGRLDFGESHGRRGG